jgi:hypothetical protein
MTVKRSILLLGIGLLVMVNWGSVFALTINIRNLLTETKDRQHHYDWLLGIPQYTIGFTITFIGLRALGGASRSLLSKVSPFNAKGTVTNLGTVVTFVGLFSQFIANFQVRGRKNAFWFQQSEAISSLFALALPDYDGRFVSSCHQYG